ncbi:MAG: Mov34/MPN/PAD-1 family protein [Actinobacteria bacterium]|nr:Mov34/MPN/PAD-1 family protein [Actinomycetota bacterium]
MKGELLVEVHAWETATAAACNEPMRETGGVLLGWRHDAGVYVCDVLVVTDRHASHTFYRRRHEPASIALEDVLASQPDGSPLGYVGEWHTHPAPTGPSWIDRREIRRISKQTAATVALLVCAFNARARTWTPVGVLAHGGRVASTEVVLRDTADDGQGSTEPTP